MSYGNRVRGLVRHPIHAENSKTLTSVAVEALAVGSAQRAADPSN